MHTVQPHLHSQPHSSHGGDGCISRQLVGDERALKEAVPTAKHLQGRLQGAMAVAIAVGGTISSHSHLAAYCMVPMRTMRLKPQ